MKSTQILIIDKSGLIGEPLSLKLSKEFPLVYVGESPSAHVSFSRKFPVIPDNMYSHIIVIVQENENLEFLHTIIKKAKDVNSDFIFARALSAKGQHHISKVLSEYPSSKVVLYGDIFDNKLIYRCENFKSVINEFIYQAQKFQRIQIPGDGLRNVYPVFISEVVDGLIDLVFGINDSHSLFYIFPKHPPTELSLAHMIQKANPEIGIDFIRHKERKEIIFYPPHGKYLLDLKYPLAKKIRSIDIQKDPPAGRKADEKKRSFPSFVLLILVFLIFSPLVFALLFSFLGLNILYFAKKQIDGGDFVNVKSSLHLSQTFFYAGKKTTDILIYQAKIVGRDRNLKRFLEDIDSGHKISQGLLLAFNAKDYYKKVLSGKSKNPTEDFTKGQSDLKSSIVILEKLHAEGKIPPQFSHKLNSINPLIKIASNTSDVLPSIFGLDGQKTYLILFQDNMELRPGGGFISAYGMLKMNMGKIEDFSIHDVYDADGKLRGHVEPPFAIRRRLPTNHWYMRDSNFDVDFVKSASISSNFLYAETGEIVSGVIGADLSFVKNILEALGPVYVANYKETVDENNLYMLTEAHSERNFLISLYKAIQVKVSQDNIPYFSVMQAVSDSLLQKHLMFAFNSNFQNIFTVNGWSSSLWDERKDQDESINDFLGINEANLGVNKVNYFIKRKVSHDVKVETDGRLLEELNISYKNNSTAWSGGNYKNYLRIILPLDATISSISINDVPQIIVDAITDFQIYEDKNFRPPIGLEVEKVSQDNKTIYGFLVDVPVGEITKIKIKYALVGSISGLNAFSYSLKLFKQPGVDIIPYSLSFTYPNSFNVINASKEIDKKEGKVLYTEKISQDKDLIINFARK